MIVPEEIWLPVLNWGNFYEVSNYGNVRSLNKTVNSKFGSTATKMGKVLKAATSRTGYKQVVLSHPKAKKNALVHRLVAQAFIPNPNNYNQVNHINGDRADNRSWMIEWCTCSQNLYHSFKHLGRKPNCSGKGRFGKLHIRSIAVTQYSLDGKFIAQFESISLAAQATNIKLSEIHACVTYPKRRTAGGYIWSKAK